MLMIFSTILPVHTQFTDGSKYMEIIMSTIMVDELCCSRAGSMYCEPDMAGGTNTLLFCILFFQVNGLRTTVEHIAQDMNSLTKI